ncbi:MAG: hypothetical protein LVQ97_01940 [Candidatus Micrarchaeales archaeon]|jgi:D-aminoacyl-tRNA deacylase|uniref:D-aminoacyl-tRNA deacylase n=1 Tax=Candidatus Micrarchaeum acidiphilum ARMAN-2 TaxID=425595 RepID=C7DIA1_MICA2|nr:MAG: Protein of unknown function DUF516 [Candidatus Micrarchaeum acidiphilum ARMAN-2]MCW6160926.1 hypothetical protein [Candidatus Micrarchaeales archaeon]
MPWIAYSIDDKVSSGVAGILKEELEFSEEGEIGGMAHYRSGNTHMLEIKRPLIYCDFLDSIDDIDFIIFPSKHVSEKGVMSYTVHSEGNWSDSAKLGGKPNELSFAIPDVMAKSLKALDSNATDGIGAVYEATHHGPLLQKPSYFIEFGGPADAVNSPRREFLDVVAKAISEAVTGSATECKKVAIGIGGSHYPGKFTKLALEGRYCFSHIMSRHYIDRVDMLEQAYSRSTLRPDCAVIEWKSMNSTERDLIIKRLNSIGIDYERA